jgi:hypothetical protein
MTAALPPMTAKAVRVAKPPAPLPNKKAFASAIVTEFLIEPHDMELVYMSPDPYSHAFEATLDLHKYDTTKNHTGGLQFITKNGRLILASMDPGTPGARIDKWCTHL